MIAKGPPRVGIDNRHRRRDHQACRRSNGSGRPRGHLDDAVAQPDAGIRHRLTFRKALADELDDLGALGELAVIEGISCLKFSEVEDRHVGLFELRPVRLLIGIDRSQASLTAPDPPRDGQRPVILRDEQGEGRAACFRPHVDDGLPGQIDIDIGRGQKDVADLRRHSAVADGHLAQGLKRERIAHGVSQDRDLAHGRIAGDRLQQALQGVARISRALAFVAIGQHAAARGLGEQDRHHGGIGVVHDLREAKDRVVEAVVEAVDEDQHLPPGNGPQGAVEPG